MRTDANAIKLVEAINAIPGLSAISSCGVYDNSLLGKAPGSTFTVSIYADPNSDGWRGLTVLSKAISDYEWPHDVELTAWFDGDDDSRGDEVQCLCFELSGTRDITESCG